MFSFKLLPAIPRSILDFPFMIDSVDDVFLTYIWNDFRDWEIVNRFARQVSLIKFSNKIVFNASNKYHLFIYQKPNDTKLGHITAYAIHYYFERGERGPSTPCIDSILRLLFVRLDAFAELFAFGFRSESIFISTAATIDEFFAFASRRIMEVARYVCHTTHASISI